VADDLQDAGVAEVDVLGLEAVRFALLRHQEVAGDLELVRLDVAGQLDDLHPVL
jgi:hypothetical protein